MEHKRVGPTQREIKAQQTHQRIFETAVSMFQEKGFEDVTVSDITKKAGVSKGTFYLYFATKESVIVEWFENLDTYYKKVFSGIPKDLPIKEQLLIFLSEMATYCEEVCGLNIIKVLYMNQISMKERAHMLTNKDRFMYTALYHYINEGKAAGEFSSEMSADEMVKIITRSIHGMFYDWCLYDGTFQMGSESVEYFSLILKLIEA